MNIRMCIWWMLFISASILLQAAIPALDVLVIGLVLVLQERRYKDLLWLLPVLILVQEGMGSRAFGGMILWYFLVIVLFAVGRWLFEVQNILFVLLMSIFMGGMHFVLVYLLAPLQDMYVNVEALAYESAIQAVFVPLAWLITAWTRKWTYTHGDTI